jgi:Leucine-rich repeat (LRR) protein
MSKKFPNELTICNNNIEIIESIANLSKLRSLRIHGEKITELPSEIGDCSSLHTLELQCPQLKTLPDSFSKLKNIRVFKLLRCNFTSIPDYICDWSELEELKIHMDNTFQGPYTDFKQLPKNIGNLKKLKIMDLFGTGIRRIPESLSECPLEYLEIDGNFRTMPETFGKLSKLKTFKFRAGMNHLKLPESFGNLSSLEELDMDSQFIEIPLSFGNLSSLKDLCIDTTELELPKTFGKLSALEQLYIDSDKMTKLPQSIGKCLNLKSIRLHCDALLELPSSIGNLKNLEELEIDTFKLKKLPNVFGNFTKLEHLSIFSGALTTIPESIGNLKKLTELSLDVYNAAKVPASLKNLSYIECPYINIGKTIQESSSHRRRNKKQRATTVIDIDEFRYMGYQYRRKIIEGLSLKEIKALIDSAYDAFGKTETEKEIVKNILCERRLKLNSKFSWTPENIKRVVEVSEKFLEAWETGFTKLKSMIDMLYEKEIDKDAFWENYSAEISLSPQILIKDRKSGEWDYPYPNNKAYCMLMDYITEWELTMNIGSNDYNPVTKDEKGFWESIHVNHRLSWNIECFGEIELRDHYICYAIHVLYSHNEWANEDILKINNIETEVEITHRDKDKIF